MRPFVENLPFLTIFLSIMAGILSASISSGQLTYRLTLAVTCVNAVCSALALQYTVWTEQNVTYTMGRFPAPYGNAILFGPLQTLLTTAFCLVLAMSLVGGERDLFHDVLPGKQRFYFTMVNLLEASLLALYQ